MRQTLVLVGNTALREKFNLKSSIFEQFFASTDEIFTLGGRLSTRL